MFEQMNRGLTGKGILIGFKEMETNVPIKDNTNSTCGSCKGKCCRGCAYSFGYFRSSHDGTYENCSSEVTFALRGLRDDSLIKESLETLRKHWGDSVQWSVTNGFLTATGCSIPREHRSRTCREYICAFLQAKIKGEASKENEEYFNERVADWHKERVERGLDIIYNNVKVTP